MSDVVSANLPVSISPTAQLERAFCPCQSPTPKPPTHTSVPSTRLAGVSKKTSVLLSISPILIRRVYRAGNASPAQQGEKSMRFMMIYKPANFRDMETGVPPTAEHMAAMGKLIGELA